MFRRSVGLLCVSVLAAAQARAQAFPGSDYVIRNFKFESGETLGELRIHYITMG